MVFKGVVVIFLYKEELGIGLDLFFKYNIFI